MVDEGRILNTDPVRKEIVILPADKPGESFGIKWYFEQIPDIPLINKPGPPKKISIVG